MWALWIFIGMMIGGTLGAMTMCLFQINKEDNRQSQKSEEKEKEE